MSASYTHEISVRYAEVDLQGVVFNAHELVWVAAARRHRLRCSAWGTS